MTSQKDVANKRSQNSYEKPTVSAPDIQQPGKPGDVGNGAATGHMKPHVPDAHPIRKSSDSRAGGEVDSPDEGAEPSNTYSGT